MTKATLGIGDLAQATGVPVRTIRFYCDEGVLEAVRSAGGHRRFDRSAVDRLRLIRRLRGLGLGLGSIRSVLSGSESMSDVVTAERQALDVELAALAWRRASLRAVEQASPSERAARLDLLAAVQDRAAARDSLVEFWQRLFLGPMPDEFLEMFLSVSVPSLPDTPSPAQVVAYAEMVVLLSDPSLRARMLRRTLHNLEQISDEGELHEGVNEACSLARPLVLSGVAPEPGHALDHFVGAHARVRRERDTASFRRALFQASAIDASAPLRRYWQLVGTLTGEPVTVGESHTWLVDALGSSVKSLPTHA
ncbi:MerR family transcriptional regulator [Kibdelosporangium persicum]|uniref:DNA-binding transcriptional MerR regulator n=1 Tax=Kibdelosporangium persicum TaxID=2698649 RepID=A0ABX2F7L9_9PSEU|nr:MerR family transcriptional regulator [Kibdelosporangium persicum]NRN67341.1 DNA-binding transcriptional MerR regulator [Kibdelosporangium persicum]